MRLRAWRAVDMDKRMYTIIAKDYELFNKPR
jgi:hypothetical protein